MNRSRPPFYPNKQLKKKQQEIINIHHNHNMKEIKSLTAKLMQHHDIHINNSKRFQIKQIQQRQVQRQNKALITRIEGLMHKNGNYSISKTKNIRTKASKSLNQFLRKKEEYHISQENNRMLIRLQHKKPTVDLEKLRRDWKDNQNVIKRRTNFQFYLTTFKLKQLNKTQLLRDRSIKNKMQSTKLNKIKIIDGVKMIIKIQFNNGILKIIGDTLNHKDIKVIEIGRDDAIDFIQHSCSGNIQQIFQKLRYNKSTGTLYIIDDRTINPENNQKNISNKNNTIEKQKSIEVTNRSINTTINPKHIQQHLNNSLRPTNTQQLKNSSSPQQLQNYIKQQKEQQRQIRDNLIMQPQQPLQTGSNINTENNLKDKQSKIENLKQQLIISPISAK